jgi:hypothetical protein
MRFTLSLRAFVRWLGVLAVAASVLGTAPAIASDETSRVARLNKQALDAFDNLNFDQSKTFLDEALAEANAAGLTSDPLLARTHLNLGMLLIAGFQRRDQAMEEFKAALKVQPAIAPPPGLFNPEVQAAFDEAKAIVEQETPPSRPPAKIIRQAVKPPPHPAPPEAKAVRTESGPVEEEEAEEEEEVGAAFHPSIFLSLGLGSGFGVAKGHLDANKDIYQGGVLDNSWSGGFAPSRLGHLALGVGYFLTPHLMLSIEGRIQFVSGTTPTGATAHCMPSCSPPGTALAAVAKANWFFASGPLRPFLSGGVGGGNIRQVVTLEGVTDCGSGNQQCVDTVTGGPLLLAVGGGLAYEMGSLLLLGTLTANVGVPNFMLNVDALIGVGLRL